MSSCGILAGVGTKDRPFWRSLVSPSVNAVVPKLTILFNRFVTDNRLAQFLFHRIYANGTMFFFPIYFQNFP